MHGLETKLREVLGARSANALEKAFGYETVGGLLRHFPRRYATRGELTDLNLLREDEHVTVMADVASVTRRPMRNRGGNILEVMVTDGLTSIKLTFFNQDWRAQTLVPGRRGLFSGKVTIFRNMRQLASPTYVLIPSDTEPDPEAIAAFARAFIPVYPATGAVSSWAIERAIDLTLEGLDPLVQDGLSNDLADSLQYPHLADAFRMVHQPATLEEFKIARERFAFEEALVYQSVLAQSRVELASSRAISRVASKTGLLSEFDANLPFELTKGQLEVSAELIADISQPHPMHRLLQGEVGSGKTICALRAMLAVVDAGGQAALLAPTEVLAAQHFKSIRKMLGNLVSETGLLDSSRPTTQVALLTGSMNTATRKQALLDAASGIAGIVIGTHALLSERVQFADLGLVVIDEQHRFGVEQRAALTAKAQADTRPHVLVMTATPIPRTVAMTVFGDLEISTLRELPAGRSPITSHLVPALEKPSYLARAFERIREEVSKGHQAYIVCPKISPTAVEEDSDVIEESDRLPASVEELYEHVVAGPLFGLRVGKLHGQMSAADKDLAMSAFAAGEIDVLVATTVVEVGVDVPNASIMLVMDADRFGVSQLHQLRGRVGRGKVPGLCLLATYTEPLSASYERLTAVAGTLDGFELSRIDLQQRREGDVLGANQSGKRTSLRILNVLQDEELISKARDLATEMVNVDASLKNHPYLAKRIAQILQDANTNYLEKT
jgi:ATP-dependent DNA helicase RecG